MTTIVQSVHLCCDEVKHDALSRTGDMSTSIESHERQQRMHHCSKYAYAHSAAGPCSDMQHTTAGIEDGKERQLQ
jgi:hypothetical protein